MQTDSGYHGVGFTGLLTLLFIGLKLTNTIDWSWWWVLSPIWITVSVLLLVFLMVGAAIGIIACFASRK